MHDRDAALDQANAASRSQDALERRDPLREKGVNHTAPYRHNSPLVPASAVCPTTPGKTSPQVTISRRASGLTARPKFQQPASGILLI